ncbi:hypothetical protein GOODEAATRI_004011, partial [Goodea atripinnis]
LRQRREADAALFSELHRKLQTQVCWKLWGAFCPSPPEGRALNPVLLHPTPELGLRLRRTKRRVVWKHWDKRGFKSRSLHAEWTHADATDTAGWSLGSRLAWALPINSSPSATMAPPSTRPPFGPQVPAPRAVRPRRDGDAAGEVSEAALVRDILYVFQGIDGKFIKMSAQENCYKIDSKVRKLLTSEGEIPQLVEDEQGVNMCTESSLTLRRLLVWMYDPKVRLKTLAALVDYCQGRKGGELASAVHAYGKTGDPQMRALVQHILSLVSHPILNFLYRWIYDGELEDTYHEVQSFLW